MSWFTTLVMLNFFSAIVFCLPKSDKICKMNDVECLTKLGKNVFQKVVSGDAELGLKSLDPLFEKLIEINIDTVKYKFINANITGLSQCIVKEARIPSPKTLHISFLFPVYRLHGQYEFDGTFLGASMKGEGLCSIDGTNIAVNVKTKKEFFEKNGKTHVRVTSFTVTANLEGHLKTELKTLSGDEKTAAFMKILNENPKEVVEILGSPLQKANMDKIMDNFNKYFEQISVDDVVDEHN